MLIPELGFGGAEGAFLRLAHYLAREAKVTIGVMGRPYSESLTPSREWTTLTTRRLDDGEGGGGNPVGKAGRWWRMLQRLRSLKKEHDVTISFLSGMNLLNVLAGAKARTIVSERGSKRHDVGLGVRQRLVWTRLLDTVTYRGAGRIVAASEGLAYEIVTANAGVAPRLLAIEGTVEGGQLVDAAELPVESDLESLSDFETVVAFGRLHFQKGYDILLSAFALVRANRPRARLLLIGTGPEEGRLREQAVELGMRVAATGHLGDVVMPGLRRDPLRYLKLGRVFVMPSRYEGLPNALIEAMATGVPVLASDCHWGPRSILSDGEMAVSAPAPDLPIVLKHGVLMPLPDIPGAVQTWAAEIARALASPSAERPDRGLRLATIARYDIRHTGPRWLELARSMAREAETE